MFLETLRQRAGRAARERRVELLALALAGLALGLLWSTQAVAEPQTRTTIVPATDAWHDRAAFTYRVPVENASGPYAAGTELGMGEPGYFTTLSPRFLVDFRWEPTGLDASRLSATGSLRVVAQGGDATPWRRELALDEATLAPRAANATLELSGAVPLDALAREIAADGRDPAKATWSVVAHVAYAAPDAGSEDFALPIRFDPPLYVLPDAPHAITERDHGTPQVHVETARPGAAGLAQHPAGPLLAIAGGAALLALARLDEGGEPG